MNTSYMIPVDLAEASQTNWSYTGIYKITNKISGKCYIGQAMDIRARLVDHVSAVDRGNNNTIYKAIRKYNIVNFDCRILVIVNTFGKTQDEIKKELNALESFYIHLYNSYKGGYNMTPGGDCGRLGFKHSEETILKLREAHKNYKPKRAFDVSKKTYGYDLLTKTIVEGESIADISHKTGIDYRSISQICNNTNYKNGGRFISCKRWLFSFDRSDLIKRVNWFFSDERLQLKKHRKGRKHG